MAINWDPIVNGVILVFALLWIASALTKQTIGEMLHGVMEFINGTKDDVLEKGEELAYYD